MRLVLTVPGLLATVLALPLAACNQAPTVSATNATTAEVKAKVAAATGGGAMVEPGRWEGAVTIHEMDVPGLPPAVKEQMKTRIGGPRKFVNCVTPEDVKQQKAFFTGDNTSDPSCKYDHFNMTGGKVDAAMSCKRPNAGKMSMTMSGDYAADTYKIDMTSHAEAGSPMGAMSMKMTVEAKRVGACRGTKEEL